MAWFICACAASGPACPADYHDPERGFTVRLLPQHGTLSLERSSIDCAYDPIFPYDTTYNLTATLPVFFPPLSLPLHSTGYVGEENGVARLVYTPHPGHFGRDAYEIALGNQTEPVYTFAVKNTAAPTLDPEWGWGPNVSNHASSVWQSARGGEEPTFAARASHSTRYGVVLGGWVAWNGQGPGCAPWMGYGGADAALEVCFDAAGRMDVHHANRTVTVAAVPMADGGWAHVRAWSTGTAHHLLVYYLNDDTFLYQTADSVGSGWFLQEEETRLDRSPYHHQDEMEWLAITSTNATRVYHYIMRRKPTERLQDYDCTLFEEDGYVPVRFNDTGYHTERAQWAASPPIQHVDIAEGSGAACVVPPQPWLRSVQEYDIVRLVIDAGDSLDYSYTYETDAAVPFGQLYAAPNCTSPASDWVNLTSADTPVSMPGPAFFYLPPDLVPDNVNRTVWLNASVSTPGWGRITPQGPVFLPTAANAYLVDHPFELVVDQGGSNATTLQYGATVSFRLDLYINATDNDQLFGRSDEYTLVENQYVFHILESSPLTSLEDLNITLGDPPEPLPGDAVQLPSIGVVIYNTSTELLYQPSEFVGTLGIEFVVRDRAGFTQNVTWYVTIGDVNEPIFAIENLPRIHILEDAPYHAYTVIGNITDPDLPNDYYRLEPGSVTDCFPSQGTAYANFTTNMGIELDEIGEGSLLGLAPQADTNGRCRVFFTVLDKGGTNITGVIQFEVVAVNDDFALTPAPNRTVMEDTLEDFADPLDPSLIYDVDLQHEGDTHTLLNATLGPVLNGTSEGPAVNLLGQIRYRPRPDTNGVQAVDYYVGDTGNHAQFARMYWNVLPVNDDFVVRNRTLQLRTEGTGPWSVDVISGMIDDVDLEHEGDVHEVVSTGPHDCAGFATVAHTPDFVFLTPISAQHYGNCTVTYAVRDQGGLVHNGRVEWAVEEINSAPYRNASAHPVVAGDIQKQTAWTLLTGNLVGGGVILNDDVQPQVLAITSAAVTTPSATCSELITTTTVYATHLEFGVAAARFGTCDVEYEVCDDGTSHFGRPDPRCVTGYVRLEIASANDPPVLLPSWPVLYEFPENQTGEGVLSVSVVNFISDADLTDGDGDVLSVVLDSPPVEVVSGCLDVGVTVSPAVGGPGINQTVGVSWGRYENGVARVSGSVVDKEDLRAPWSFWVNVTAVNSAFEPRNLTVAGGGLVLQAALASEAQMDDPDRDCEGGGPYTVSHLMVSEVVYGDGPGQLVRAQYDTVHQSLLIEMDDTNTAELAYELTDGPHTRTAHVVYQFQKPDPGLPAWTIAVIAVGGVGGVFAIIAIVFVIVQKQTGAGAGAVAGMGAVANPYQPVRTLDREFVIPSGWV